MRLTCPNCSARYEVDEAMVPPGGRDVQCSNCSQTWFQPGPRQAEPAAPVSPERLSAEPRLSEVAVEGPSGAPGVETQDGVQRPARRQIDPGVADILRQEAERESRLRRGEPAPDPAPQQEEMPLPEDQPRNRDRRMAELEGAADAFDTDQISAAMAVGAGREQFPDIEEINSTLRATGDRREAEANATDFDTLENAGRRRGAVRRGFFLIIILAAMAVGVYVYAAQITEIVPQVGPYLERYVDIVNDIRFWLDDLARSLANATGS